MIYKVFTLATSLMFLLPVVNAQCVMTDEARIAAGTMISSCGDVLHYQGYRYTTVQIGDQCWFAENLRSENYTNGDVIPSGLNNAEWSVTNSGASAVNGEDTECVDASPDFDACDPVQSLNAYGRLYNWYAVDDERGLCPSGWHVPTDEEWMTLEIALGMSESQANTDGHRGGTDQGTQMKTDYGYYASGNGTNSSGFAGLPGGNRTIYGEFPIAGYAGYWWSSSPADETNSGPRAWYRGLMYDFESVYRGALPERSGLSVRCIWDAE